MLDMFYNPAAAVDEFHGSCVFVCFDHRAIVEILSHEAIGIMYSFRRRREKNNVAALHERKLSYSPAEVCVKNVVQRAPHRHIRAAESRLDFLSRFFRHFDLLSDVVHIYMILSW